MRSNTYDRKSYTTISYAPNAQNPNVVPPAAQQVLTSQDKGYVFLPDVIRRVKPPDLFANATPWDAQSTHIHYGHCRHTVDNGQFLVTTSGPAYYWASYVEDPLNVSLDISDFGQLDQRMRLKIKDQKMDILSAMREMPQTAGMVVGLARDMVDAFHKLRRGHPVDAFRRILSDPRTRADRAIANRWLEYSFGVRPTLQDIYGLTEVMVIKANEGFPQYLRVQQTETRETSVNIGLVTGLVSTKIRKRVQARYVVRSDGDHTLAQLGIVNPAAFLWEAVPWSFAIDWCWQVGNFLEGFDALLGISQLHVQRSYGYDIKYQQNLSIDSGDKAISGYSKRRVRFGTTDELSLGVPAFRGFKTTSMDTRLANVGSLLRQMVR